jgi:hypothetical protein
MDRVVGQRDCEMLLKDEGYRVSGEPTGFDLWRGRKLGQSGA